VKLLSSRDKLCSSSVRRGVVRKALTLSSFAPLHRMCPSHELGGPSLEGATGDDRVVALRRLPTHFLLNKLWPVDTRDWFMVLCARLDITKTKAK
jgi:hypothetical protein